MAIAIQEIFSYVNKFIHSTTFGLETSLSLAFDGNNVSASLNTKLGMLQRPSFETSKPCFTKPSRVRRQKRRQQSRNKTTAFNGGVTVDDLHGQDTNDDAEDAAADTQDILEIEFNGKVQTNFYCTSSAEVETDGILIEDTTYTNVVSETPAFSFGEVEFTEISKVDPNSDIKTYKDVYSDNTIKNTCQAPVVSSIEVDSTLTTAMAFSLGNCHESSLTSEIVPVPAPQSFHSPCCRHTCTFGPPPIESICCLHRYRRMT